VIEERRFDKKKWRFVYRWLDRFVKRERQLGGRDPVQTSATPGRRTVEYGDRTRRSRLDGRPTPPAQSRTEGVNLIKENLLVIMTNAMGRHVHIEEVDCTDQRFFSFVFTPGTDHFHGHLREQT
jgi:hypothetical protein